MARFRDGFTYERNVSASLTIEGQPIQLIPKARGFAARLPRGGSVEAETIDELVHNFVTKSGALAERIRTKAEHLKQLANGKLAWNAWRLDHPDVHPMFADEDLRSVSTHPLDEYDFSYTNFTQANLSGLHLRRANFHQAILAAADCSAAHFEGANFCRTDMYETIFTDAHFEGANLQGVQLARTNLRAAHMTGCKVYGLSAWDLKVNKHTEQEKLQITYRQRSTRSNVDETVIVDDLDLAAFIYMTLSNRNISRVFDATGRKWVLLLGRFGKRRDVLKRLRRALKKRQLVPIVFDFSRPKHADLIETVVLLAGMSAFVIVDITDPKSTPMELQAIAPTFGVPIVPIIQSPQREFGSFPSLRKWFWVLPTVSYTTVDDLVANLDKLIVKPAYEWSQWLERVKRGEISFPETSNPT
jgi:uncharacterized protein YjbI with pentapeptide repeats